MSAQLQQLQALVGDIKRTVEEARGPIHGSRESAKTLNTIAYQLEKQFRLQAARARAALGDAGSRQQAAQLEAAANAAKLAAQYLQQGVTELDKATNGAVSAATTMGNVQQQLNVRG